VALYFWGPLVWGWVAKDEAAAPPPDARPAALGASLGQATVATTETPPTPHEDNDNASTHPWTQLDEWMRHDPMTTPVEDVTGWKDPFAVASSGPEAVERDEGRGDLLPASPEALGIELSGTLVGPHGRVALIGGKAYREGQAVKIDRDGQLIEFELAEVHSRRIVLGREGHQFDLAIPDRNRAEGIETPGDEE
jgi:hypothetical protein